MSLAASRHLLWGYGILSLTGSIARLTAPCRPVWLAGLKATRGVPQAESARFMNNQEYHGANDTIVLLYSS
jgi:hypothetical protein